MSAKEKVQKKFPNSFVVSDEDGYFIRPGNHADAPNIGCIGLGSTEEEAWENAAEYVAAQSAPS